jgi:glycerol-3-phosphate acyltransferase PlsX
MGGDRAPGEIVAGARQAAAELGRPVVLVGRPEEIDALDGGAGGLDVIAAGEVIAMDEDPAQGVRRKKDSSLVRAAEAVRDGRASAMVSAGNTGATMASALLRMGRLAGVARPAIATPIPVPGSTPTVLLDAGANAECAPAWMVQFAQMGSVFARERFGIAEPRVGLLSIGEEPAKGTTLVKEVHELLAATPGVRFIGNVEGRVILSDAVDVVVTDGFTGNVALKTLEGSLRFLVDAILAAFSANEEARQAAKVLLPALAPLADELDPDSHGGAMLLGVAGVCIISHGSSSARAIVNAVRVAHEMVERDLVGALREAVGQPQAKPGPPRSKGQRVPAGGPGPGL